MPVLVPAELELPAVGEVEPPLETPVPPDETGLPPEDTGEPPLPELDPPVPTGVDPAMLTVPVPALPEGSSGVPELQAARQTSKARGERVDQE